MGGKVEVKSKIGKGSEFMINLKTHCLVKTCNIDQNQVLMNIDDGESSSSDENDHDFVFIKRNKQTGEITSCISEVLMQNQ
jgi:hypothetical protein